MEFSTSRSTNTVISLNQASQSRGILLFCMDQLTLVRVESCVTLCEKCPQPRECWRITLRTLFENKCQYFVSCQVFQGRFFVMIGQIVERARLCFPRIGCGQEGGHLYEGFYSRANALRPTLPSSYCPLWFKKILAALLLNEGCTRHTF